MRTDVNVTAETVRSKFSAARAVLSGAAVTVRHNGQEYSGIRSTLAPSSDGSAVAAVAGATGALRISVAELGNPLAVPGDTIQVQEQGMVAGQWIDRVILAARYDQVGGTVRWDYGEKYG